jgi:hypothetical protein
VAAIYYERYVYAAREGNAGLSEEDEEVSGCGISGWDVDDPEIAILLEAARYVGTCFSGPCPSFIMFVWRNFVHEEE